MLRSHLAIGREVKAGDVLVVLDDRVSRLHVAEAQARLAELQRATSQAAAAGQAQAEEAALNLNVLTARLVEAKLESLDLNPGAVDGQFDDDTRRAIRRYQDNRDLPVTGYLNEPTLVRLLADTIGALR